MSEFEIALFDDEGDVYDVLLEPSEHRPVPNHWWPILDAADVCRYCLKPYDRCTCAEVAHDV